MNGSTATPTGAREHARAKAGTVVAAMPVIPVSSARDLPADVHLSTVIWDETIAAGGYTSRVLRRGTRLRLIDLEGDACVNLVVYNADHPEERLNVADTVKVQWNAYLGEGRLLLSDMGRVLMTITRDEGGSHDAFGGCSNEQTNRAKYGDGTPHGPHPSGRDRLLLALAKHGLGRKDLMANINLFKSVRIDEDGGMKMVPESSRAGAFIELRAEMNVLVALANTPHVLDDRGSYRATPVRLLAYGGPVTPAEDPVRNATPEGLRAFQNTEDLFTV